jgi:hypothetical protein
MIPVKISSILLKKQNPMMYSATYSTSPSQTCFFHITTTTTAAVVTEEDIYDRFLEQQHIPCTGEAFQIFFEDSIKAS